MPLRTERIMTEDDVQKNASFRPRIDMADPARLEGLIDWHACSSSMVLNPNVLEKVVRASFKTATPIVKVKFIAEA
jgi:hypothetical protein